MILAIRDSRRQDKQQNQIKTTNITYDQNSMIFFLKKLNDQVKIASDTKEPKQAKIQSHFNYARKRWQRRQDKNLFTKKRI